MCFQFHRERTSLKKTHKKALQWSLSLHRVVFLPIFCCWLLLSVSSAICGRFCHVSGRQRVPKTACNLFARVQQAQRNHSTTRKRADCTPKPAPLQIPVPRAGTSPRALLADPKAPPAHPGARRVPQELIPSLPGSRSQTQPCGTRWIFPDPKENSPAFSHPGAPRARRGEP